jgi:hypothetical protein
MNILVLLAIVVVISISIGVVYGFEGISIIRSDSCIKLNCIKVSELLKYDNSTQTISGKFILVGDDYIRQKGMKNSMDFYKNIDKTIVFVEPDMHTLSRTKKIVIEPHLQEYALQHQKNKKQLDSLTDVRYTASGMYANKGCTVLTIGIKQVNITTALEYIGSDCKKGQTPFLNEFITNKTKLNHCGNDCQYKKFLKDAKSKSKSFLLPFKKEFRNWEPVLNQ